VISDVARDMHELKETQEQVFIEIKKSMSQITFSEES